MLYSALFVIQVFVCVLCLVRAYKNWTVVARGFWNCVWLSWCEHPDLNVVVRRFVFELCVGPSWCAYTRLEYALQLNGQCE